MNFTNSNEIPSINKIEFPLFANSINFSDKTISFKQLQISKIGYPKVAIPALIAIHFAVSTLSPVSIHNLIPASKKIRIHTINSVNFKNIFNFYFNYFILNLFFFLAS